ncbi:MAG: protoheme IX farnesyltransferase [Ignavibacteriae bacterium]|nr:protoheme IX farnesyltransferase [Ignavibacteriota bacterium]
MEILIKNIKYYLELILILCKVRITFFVAVTTALGYILASGTIDIGLILPVLGVFLLACGSSAFNQFQEYVQDSMMKRTMFRPIPTSKLSPRQGFYIALIMSISGASILMFTADIKIVLLGIFTLIWYNLIYTPMKKKSSLAVVPGALIGAIPPVIGWLAGGGNLANPQIWILSLFFFIWQIPHFWLLLLIYEDDYRRAGFPALTDIISRETMTRITYVWISALAASCMLIPLFGLSDNIISGFILFIAGCWLMWRTKNLLRLYSQKNIFRFAFMNINLYVLAVAVVLIAEKLL